MGNKTRYTRNAVTYNSTTILGTSVPPGRLAWTDSYVRIGEDNPKFKSLIEAGLDATNDLTTSVSKTVMKLGSYSGTITSGVYKDKSESSTRGGFSAPVVLTTSSLNATLTAKAEAAAAIAIRNKISKANNPFKGLTFLGELRETVGMLKRPVTLLEKATRQLSKDGHKLKSDFKRAGVKVHPDANGDRPQSVTNAFGDMWLTYAFGVAPLVGEITEAAELAHGIMMKNEIKRVRASSVTDSSVHSQTTTAVGIDSGLQAAVKFSTDTVNTVRVSYNVGLKVAFSNKTPFENLMQRGGLSWDEVIPTIWELLPWSFMVDYFSNIGDVLSASTVDLSNVAYVSKTTREDVRRSVRTVMVPNQFIKVNHHIPAEQQLSFTRVKRVGGAIPNPELRFDFPNRVGQFINIAALFAVCKT